METLKVHYLQHVSFEGLGSMDKYFSDRNYEVTSTKLYDNEELPEEMDFDLLVIMGGPMGVRDTDVYPWLVAEEAFVKSAIDDGKFVLGICLGAQIIAHSLGAEVTENRYREIGWHSLEINENIEETFFADIIEDGDEVFHWHGETFSIPEGAVHIASSQACENQAFIYNERVLAFQFHLETTAQSAKTLMDNCGSELDSSEFTSTPEEIMGDSDRFLRINEIMSNILDRIVQKMQC